MNKLHVQLCKTDTKNNWQVNGFQFVNLSHSKTFPCTLVEFQYWTFNTLGRED